MNKAFVLALVAALALLLTVGCSGDTIPVGATVRLLEPSKGFVEMYSATNPNAAIFATILVDRECEVASQPRAFEDITFWGLDCPKGAYPFVGREFRAIGWIDVTSIEVLD